MIDATNLKIQQSVCAKCGGTGIIKGGPTDSRNDTPCSCFGADSNMKLKELIPDTDFKTIEGKLNTYAIMCGNDNTQISMMELLDFLEEHPSLTTREKIHVAISVMYTIGVINQDAIVELTNNKTKLIV